MSLHGQTVACISVATFGKPATHILVGTIRDTLVCKTKGQRSGRQRYLSLFLHLAIALE